MTKGTAKARAFRLVGQNTVFRAVCFYDAAVLIPSVIGVTKDGTGQTAARLADIEWLDDARDAPAIEAKRHSAGMTYEEAKAHREALIEARERARRALKQHGELKGPNGPTPDSDKQTPEWKRDYDAYWAAYDALRKFDRGFTKNFAREHRAERRAKRASR